jgi:hypothetical protein
MMDFILDPERIERLTRGIIELEIKWVRRYAALGFHAIGCADDYGCQRGTLFSPATFRRFFKPAYTALATEAHRLGLDVWLHSCGNLSAILGDFAEAGIDMLHPIQVGCFDEGWVRDNFTGKIGFHIGMDVQHLLVEATPQEVERVCSNRLRLFANARGGVAAAAGNAIMPETPMENALQRFRKGGEAWLSNA